MIDQVGPRYGNIDILIHSVAFSPEIKNKAVDTSRAAYLQAHQHQFLFADGPGPCLCARSWRIGPAGPRSSA